MTLVIGLSNLRSLLNADRGKADVMLVKSGNARSKQKKDRDDHEDPSMSLPPEGKLSWTEQLKRE